MGKQTEQLCAVLEALLVQMTTLQVELLDILGRKREALRRGRHGLLAELCALETEKVQATSELEKKRLQVVAQLTLLLNPKASQPLPMAELAERMPEPVKGRLLTLRVQLREKLTAVKDQTAVARRAADALVRHMQGLVQSVVAVSNLATTYSRQGASRPNASLSTFSMTA